MFLLRKLGALIRGRTTPFQIYSACLLGALIAFNPGLRQAPGLLVVEVALLVVLNANLFVAAIVGLGAKLLYLLLLPWLFQLGVWLVEGPLHGPLAALANAPVTAWFGFEFYVVSAGLLVALPVGLVAGFLLNRQIRRIQRRLGRWEHDSAAYRKWSEKRWVKVFAFIFIGGTKARKGSWEELGQSKGIGNPIRPLGAALVVLSIVLGVIILQFFNSLILTEATRTVLERTNGATVDLEAVTFDAREGKLSITRLAMTDPEQLDTNLFAAGLVEADVSGMDLLTRKIALDRLELSDASTGAQRGIPGRRVGPAPKPVEPPPETEQDDVYSVEEVIAEAEKWKDRLAQLSDWWKRFGPDQQPEEVPDEAPDRELTWRERLEQRAQLEGYAQVASENLVRQAPRFTIREVVANGVRIGGLPDELVNFQGSNLSTQPWLSAATPRFSAQAQSGKFGLNFDGVSYTSEAGANQLRYFYNDLPASALASVLKDPARFPIKEGIFTIRGEGTQEGIGIELPLQVTVRDAQVALGSLDPVSVRSMDIPASIGGTIAAPALRVDSSAIENLLRNAARDRLQQEAEKQLQDKLPGEAGDALRRILGGGNAGGTDTGNGSSGAQPTAPSADALLRLFGGSTRPAQTPPAAKPEEQPEGSDTGP